MENTAQTGESSPAGTVWRRLLNVPRPTVGAAYEHIQATAIGALLRPGTVNGEKRERVGNLHN